MIQKSRIFASDSRRHLRYSHATSSRNATPITTSSTTTMDADGTCS